MLPTPVASDSNGVSPLRTTIALLPTPVVNDMGAGKTPEQWDDWTGTMRDRHGNGNGHGPSLAIEAQRLLQTPSAADGAGGHLSRGGDRSGELLLKGQIMDAGRTGSLGPYQAACDRWAAVTGRPAPDPTTPGATGNPGSTPDSWNG